MTKESQNQKGPIYEAPGVLTGMRVGQAMKKVLPRTGGESSLSQCIRLMIRTREDAVLIEDSLGKGVGVITKTDIMGAFYGGLSIDTHGQDIMAGPLEICSPESGVDQALEQMTARGIHQIFVAETCESPILGKLGYDDIAGLVYRYCRSCKKGHRRDRNFENCALPRLRVKEVMTREIQTCNEDEMLYTVMDILSSGGIKALPVVNSKGEAMGVVSKTDLMLAYAHGGRPEQKASEIMNAPIATCMPKEPLSQVLLDMLLSDIQHLFVSEQGSESVHGVLSLSDAARFRSGTCKACTASRIL